VACQAALLWGQGDIGDRCIQKGHLTAPPCRGGDHPVGSAHPVGGTNEVDDSHLQSAPLAIPENLAEECRAKVCDVGLPGFCFGASVRYPGNFMDDRPARL